MTNICRFKDLLFNGEMFVVLDKNSKYIGAFNHYDIDVVDKFINDYDYLIIDEIINTSKACMSVIKVPITSNKFNKLWNKTVKKYYSVFVGDKND